MIKEAIYGPSSVDTKSGTSTQSTTPFWYMSAWQVSPPATRVSTKRWMSAPFRSPWQFMSASRIPAHPGNSHSSGIVSPLQSKLVPLAISVASEMPLLLQSGSPAGAILKALS